MMKHSSFHRGLWAWLAIGAAALLCGCGPRGGQQYIPSEETAQRTLEAALAAWQQGATPPDLVAEGPPGIRLVDTHHKPKQKLSAFTVLGPSTGDAHRCFAVRLTLDNPREEVRTRFVVLGLDPLWVIRYEDLEMFAHWECATSTTAAQKQSKGK
jgi:hypothetical protein